MASRQRGDVHEQTRHSVTRPGIDAVELRSRKKSHGKFGQIFGHPLKKSGESISAVPRGWQTVDFTTTEAQRKPIQAPISKIIDRESALNAISRGLNDALPNFLDGH
ncbi:hypothetical protein Cob_v002930 [Colletotrichum orbiculare MAFF 240422]|uniref:Uncharacterized protein n=1 Tax=Colletotrichum orbiculare (strain 104-T / ATCC 96160 / CBS 514.97 / LARS 414 / MAFF 240422) TaxID=1213857 RepID=A0A484G270_COLOR|nr:hypothetical protein Cob_v002930 [Colletotrichum orbiculare MAFF 240422]